MTNAVGGTLYASINGNRIRAKGNFTYNLGLPKREPVIGADGVHGYKEVQQTAMIEGSTTDRGDLNLEELLTAEGVTFTLDLANGKTIALYDAWFAGDGNVTTEEGEVPLKFEGLRAEVLVG